jgi:hypothetical protein
MRSLRVVSLERALKEVYLLLMFIEVNVGNEVFAKLFAAAWLRE